MAASHGPPAGQADSGVVSENFEKNARNVTIITFLSRMTGLARDAAMSRCIGAEAVGDAFAFAFMIPNLFRRLFGEGALSAAFLPVYARLDKENPDLARRVASLLVAGLLVGLGGLTLLAEGVLAGVLTWSGVNEFGVRLTMIMLPYMPLVCLVAILGTMLQVKGRFGPIAAAPIILNLSIVAPAIWFAKMQPGTTEAWRATVLSWCVLLAGVIQVLWALSAARKGLGRPAWSDPEARSSLRTILAQALPMILGLGVLQLNTFVDGLIASYPTTMGPTIFGIDYPLDSGAMASLSYAQRLYEFPLGVFGIAVATAVFPLLARQANDAPAFMETVRRGLRLVMFIGVPASLGLILVRDQLTAVVLQGGKFLQEDTHRVGFILVGYAPAIWAYSANHTLTRAFYALGDSRTPVKVSLAIVALNFLLNISLIWTPLKEAGLAWSTATCAVVQCVVLTRLLHGRIGTIVDDSVRRGWLSTLAATAAMVAAVLGASWLLGEGDGSWRRRVLELAVMVAAGASGMLVGARLLRMPELRWALGRR
jgi:putative peptidoglycan lipid II flippase